VPVLSAARVAAQLASSLSPSAVAHTIESGALQPFDGFFPGFAQTVQTREQGQVFDGGKLVIERDSVAQDADSTPGRFAADVGAENIYVSLGRPGKSRDDPQQCGFTRAVAAQKSHGGTRRDTERYIPQCREITIVFENAVDFECVQAAPFLYSITPPTPRMAKVRPSTQGSCV